MDNRSVWLILTYSVALMQHFCTEVAASCIEEDIVTLYWCEHGCCHDHCCSKAESLGTEIWVFIGLGIGLLVLFAVLGIVLYLKSRKKSSSGPSGRTSGSENTASLEPSSVNLQPSAGDLSSCFSVPTNQAVSVNSLHNNGFDQLSEQNISNMWTASGQCNAQWPPPSHPASCQSVLQQSKDGREADTTTESPPSYDSLFVNIDGYETKMV